MPTDPKPLRIAFIGAGGIAQAQVDHLAKIPGVTVVAAADVGAKAVESFAAKVVSSKAGSDVRTYDDPAKLLKAEAGTLDAVSVCTPNGLHAVGTIAALKAGCHVLVEKPMAMNAKECAAMNAAAKKAGKHLVVGFQWRFDPRAQLLRQQVQAGRFGKILYVRVQALRRRGIPDWGVFGRKDLQGGGPMIDIGVHVSEMAHYVMGAPKPVRASGNCWTYLGDKPMTADCTWPNWDHKTYTVEDLAVGQVRFADGSLMSIESSFAAHIKEDVWNFQIMGTEAGATFDPLLVFRDHDGNQWNEAPGWLADGNWGVAFERKMRHFVAVCRGERTSEATGEDGMKVQQILDGIYASAKTGAEVKLG